MDGFLGELFRHLLLRLSEQCLQLCLDMSEFLYHVQQVKLILCLLTGSFDSNQVELVLDAPLFEATETKNTPGRREKQLEKRRYWQLTLLLTLCAYSLFESLKFICID